MKKLNKIIFFGIIVATIVGVFAVYNTSAQSSPLEQSQINLIKSDCIAIKSTLNQIHSSDALMRVNMGQTYESISTKLIKRFNDRAYLNNMDNDKLVILSNNYDQLLNNFRNSYIIYEQHLSLAMDIDCKKDPESFYNAVALARNYRLKVREDIVSLNSELIKYQLEIAQFVKDNNRRIEDLSK